MIGKKRRLQRIFQRDGRTLIVALDHGGFMDRPASGLIDPVETVRRVVAGGADAVMTTLGSARAIAEALEERGLILTVQNKAPVVEAAVETALRVGADAVKVICYPWYEKDPESVNNAARLGEECVRWEMPYLVETIPGGFEAGPEMRTPEKLAGAARIGAELGADFIKTFYPGDAHGMQVVAENCPVPVVILGGERGESERQILELVAAALEGGAAGVAMGRNIWGHPAPERITAATAQLLHGGANVDQAMRELEKKFTFS